MDSVKPETLINIAGNIPFKIDGRDENGLDCWGFIEFWYDKRFGIKLNDRGDKAPSPLGLKEGFDTYSDWKPLNAPEDDCLLVMKALWNGEVHQFGHVGIYYNGIVIHHEENAEGQCIQPYKNRFVRQRVTAIGRHKDR